MVIKILFDCSSVDVSLFQNFHKNNILELVKKNKISFFMPDILFYEKFIPLSYRNPDEFNSVLENCFKYCTDNIFLHVNKIINNEVKNQNINAQYCFYPNQYIQEFKKDFYNNRVKWNEIEHEKLITKNNNIGVMLNSFIQYYKNNIDLVKSKIDLQNFKNSIEQDFNIKTDITDKYSIFIII